MVMSFGIFRIKSDDLLMFLYCVLVLTKLAQTPAPIVVGMNIFRIKRNSLLVFLQCLFVLTKHGKADAPIVERP